MKKYFSLFLKLVYICLRAFLLMKNCQARFFPICVVQYRTQPVAKSNNKMQFFVNSSLMILQFFGWSFFRTSGYLSKIMSWAGRTMSILRSGTNDLGSRAGCSKTFHVFVAFSQIRTISVDRNKKKTSSIYSTGTRVQLSWIWRQQDVSFSQGVGIQ